MVVVVGDTPTLKKPVFELGPKLPCKLYVAIKTWLPRVGLEIVKAVVPLVSNCDVAPPPSTLNDTLPVGVKPVATTVTVTVPFDPNATDGALMLVVVDAGFTVKDPVLELAAKFPWAAYVAERAWLAAFGAVIVKVAVPLVSSSGVKATPSTLNATLPVGVPEDERTVTPTAPFTP